MFIVSKQKMRQSWLDLLPRSIIANFDRLSYLRHVSLGVIDYYKRLLWLDKRYNLVALVQSELGSCTSCPIRVCVCNNRSPLAWHISYYMAAPHVSSLSEMNYWRWRCHCLIYQAQRNVLPSGTGSTANAIFFFPVMPRQGRRQTFQRKSSN